MSWATPRTWVSGNILTAAQLNTDVRDNSNASRGQPRVRAYRNSSFAIPTLTVTPIPFDAEVIDTHGIHSTSVNTSRFTVPSGWAGDWLFGATIFWEPNTTGDRRHCEINVNGALKIVDSDQPPGSSGGVATQSCSAIWFPVAGDFFESAGYHDRGSNLNVQPSAYGGTIFWAHMLGAGVG